MERDRLHELHYITPITNVPSILDRRSLSHALAMKVRHASIAKEEVQDRRKKVVIPNGLAAASLRQSLFLRGIPCCSLGGANMSRLRSFVSIPPSWIFPGVVVSDQNAASRYARFGASPAALRFVNFQRVFAEYWTDADAPIAEWRNKSIKCAEVLVPRQVEPMFILGAYVSGQRGIELNFNLATNFEGND